MEINVCITVTELKKNYRKQHKFVFYWLAAPSALNTINVIDILTLVLLVLQCYKINVPQKPVLNMDVT